MYWKKDAVIEKLSFLQQKLSIKDSMRLKRLTKDDELQLATLDCRKDCETLDQENFFRGNANNVEFNININTDNQHMVSLKVNRQKMDSSASASASLPTTPSVITTSRKIDRKSLQVTEIEESEKQFGSADKSRARGIRARVNEKQNFQQRPEPHQNDFDGDNVSISNEAMRRGLSDEAMRRGYNNKQQGTI